MAKRTAGKSSPSQSDVPVQSDVSVSSGKKTTKSSSGGPIREMVRFLGSLKLAVGLLVVLAAVLTGATLLESDRGTEYVQWYVYQSPWFLALLALLGVNTLAAMLVRLPWKRRHIGFVVAHAGVLVLMAGSLQTFLAGVKGQVAFMEGETADTMVVSDRSQLTTREEGSSIALDFPFEPGPTDWPEGKTLDLGKLDEVEVRVIEFYRHARRQTDWAEDPSALSGPAIRFEVLDPGGKQVAQQWLVARNFTGAKTTVGPANFALYEVPIRSMLDDLLSPPTDKLGTKGLLCVYYKDQVRRIPVDENLSGKLPVGDDGTQVEIAKYVPNAMHGAGGKSGSAEEKARNPLLELRVHLPGGNEPLQQIAFAKAPFLNLGISGGRACPVKFFYLHPDVSATRGTEFLQTPDGKLYCRIGSDGRYQSQGEVNQGDRVEMFVGFEVRLLQHIPHAKQDVTFQPVEVKPGEEGAPEAAALFEVTVAGKTYPTWLLRDSRQYGSDTIQTPRGSVLLEFGYPRESLGFSLKLLDAVRGMEPGGSVIASYSSSVELVDKSLGLTRQHTIAMNRPLKHGKFTLYQSGLPQASDGRDVSILGVTYDPGSFLKYVGSLMACVGTFVMIYLRGRPFKRAPSDASPKPNAGASDSPRNRSV